MSVSPAPYSSHVYIECDIPDDMTLREWRRSRRQPPVASPLSQLLRRARRARRARRQQLEI